VYILSGWSVFQPGVVHCNRLCYEWWNDWTSKQVCFFL